MVLPVVALILKAIIVSSGRKSFQRNQAVHQKDGSQDTERSDKPGPIVLPIVLWFWLSSDQIGECRPETVASRARQVWVCCTSGRGRWELFPAVWSGFFLGAVSGVVCVNK